MKTYPIVQQTVPTSEHREKESMKQQGLSKRSAFQDLLDEDEEPNDSAAEGNLPPPFLFNTHLNQVAQTASITAPAAIYALLEKMASEIMIMKTDGVTITHLSLKTEHLSEIELSIHHSASDPDHFKIEIAANEEAGRLIQKHQLILSEELKKALPTMRCEIATSFYAAPTPIKRPEPKKAVEKSKEIGYCPVRRLKEVL